MFLCIFPRAMIWKKNVFFSAANVVSSEKASGFPTLSTHNDVSSEKLGSVRQRDAA